MGIDNKVLEIFRTELSEVWGHEVDDKTLFMYLELTILASVMKDMDHFKIPKTLKLMEEYFEEKGIPLEKDFVDEEGDSDAKEIRENKVELKETPHAEENS